VLFLFGKGENIMYRLERSRNFWQFLVAVFVVLGMALYPAQNLQAQTADEPSGAPTAEEGAEEIEEKGEITPGDANPVDAGPAVGENRVYIPSISGNDNAEAHVAAIDATILLDEFCSFPSGWTRYDYDGSGHLWVEQAIGGRCVAKPNGYINDMATYMERVVNLAGGNIAGAFLDFRFRMNTETGFDFLRYEYSCNNRRTWRGSTHSDSGAYGGASPGFINRTVSLAECDGSASVYIRFWFQTDRIIVGAEAPALDYVRVRD
jgi:hypothetical protein